jgi:hypothetical protein
LLHTGCLEPSLGDDTQADSLTAGQRKGLTVDRFLVGYKIAQQCVLQHYSANLRACAIVLVPWRYSPTSNSTPLLGHWNVGAEITDGKEEAKPLCPPFSVATVRFQARGKKGVDLALSAQR